MRFPRRQFLYLTVGAATLPAFGGIAGAQTSPTRPVRRGEIMGRQRAKSADLAWPPQFGARSVDYKGLGPKDRYVRTRTDSATVASPTRLRRQANAAGAPSNA